MTGTTIEDSFTGIDIIGALDAISYRFTLVDNTITGVGPSYRADSMEGIGLGEGAAGEVKRNTISGFSYIGDGSNREGLLAHGILAIAYPSLVPLPPMTFEENVLKDNQVHLTLIRADDSVVSNNTFEGILPGIDPYGLWITGDSIQVRGNEFRDLPLGILLGGVHPPIGDLFGYAVDAQLTNNRFCDVTTQVYSEPGASHNEQGTLTCPFPAPMLEIRPAVLFSWPEVE